MKESKKACKHASLTLPSLGESSAFCSACVIGGYGNESIGCKYGREKTK